MSDELSIREQLLNNVDEVLVDLEEGFKGYFTEAELPMDEFKARFADNPVLSKLSDDAFRPMLQELFEAFWKEFKAEIAAFSAHWKSLVPSEEVLAALDDGQIEAMYDEFEAEMELVFNELMRKFRKNI